MDHLAFTHAAIIKRFFTFLNFDLDFLDVFLYHTSYSIVVIATTGTHLKFQHGSA